MIQLDAIFGRNPMNLRCSEVSYNTISRTLFFKNKNGWARVPYIGAPSRDVFNQKTEQHKFYVISNSKKDPFKYIAEIKATFGPDIYISNNNTDKAVRIGGLMEIHCKVFAIEDRPIGQFTSYEAAITTIEGRTASVHQYKLAVQYDEPMTKEMQRLKKMTVLKKCPNNRGFNTPILAVPKPDGSIRTVMNFKVTLNKILCDMDSF